MSTLNLETSIAGKSAGRPGSVGKRSAAIRFALIDNGSLAAEPHLLLRRVAAEISRKTGVEVAAVSWKHSDRAKLPDGSTAPVLKNWVPEQAAAGARAFVFIPFFVSPQGAIAGALRKDLDEFRVAYRFSQGLLPDTLGRIVEERVRNVIEVHGLDAATVVVVDHGGPSPISGAVRDQAAAIAADLLGQRVARVIAASMENGRAVAGVADPGRLAHTVQMPGSATPATTEASSSIDLAFAHNQPLLAEALRRLAAPSPEAPPTPAPRPSSPVIIAPLFLSPGRHAGPEGDLAQIAAAAAPGRLLFFAELIGAHPLVPAALAAALVPHIPIPTALP